MFEGVKLVGKHDSPACYPLLLKPATLVADDVCKSAVWRRRALVGRCTSADPAHIEHLETTAMEKLKLGFVEGLFASEAEVSAYLAQG